MNGYTIHGKPTGVVHVRSLVIERCPAQSRYRADSFEKFAVRESAGGALYTAETLGRVCKFCRRELEAIVNGVDTINRSVVLGGEMPSLEEIATETPLPTAFPVPVIPVFTCLVSADMRLTRCNQVTASVRSTIDMYDATCPSCVGLVRAELEAASHENGQEDDAPAPTATRTREEWLIAAVSLLTGIFTDQGFKVPPVRISVGLPGGKTLKGLHKTIGQCWSSAAAADGVQQIFISPLLDDPAQILATIMHELVHAVDGCKNEHKAAFKRIAVLVGLEGKMTETVAGAALLAVFPAVVTALGEYDHAKLSPGMGLAKPQTNKHLKIMCADLDCEFQSRVTRKQLDVYGISQHCGRDMYEA